MLHNDEWKNLSAAAKILYVIVKSRFNGKNNGHIQVHYSSLVGIKGLSSPSTISKAFRKLETKGWNRRTNLGGLFGRINEYLMTGKFDDYIP